MDKSGFTTDDLVGVVLGFLREQKKEDNPYITKEGLSFLSGYCKGNNTISLIESEKYDKLLKDFEELIEKYSELKHDTEQLKTNHKALLFDYHKLKQKKRWFKW